MKKLLMSALMLLLAGVLLGSTTFAWFSMNKEVSATGMKVSAKADASLVITTDALPMLSDGAFSVDFAATKATELLCSTHDSSYTTYASGLKYITNPGKIDPSTGLAKMDTSKTPNVPYTLEYANATSSYYFDKIVYIASAGEALKDHKLSMSFIKTQSNINGAISVDFYVKSVTEVATESDLVKSDNFKGTLNLLGADPTKTDGTAKTAVEVTGLTIPAVAETGTTTKVGAAAIAVLMRIYVDGALQTTSDKTVTNNGVASSIVDTDVEIKFTATSTK